MKACLALVALAASAVGQRLTAEYVAENHEAMWASFKGAHGKRYGAAEEGTRKAIFRANMMDAAAAHASNPHATFGATKFSDLTYEEFSAAYASGLPAGAPQADAAEVHLYGAEQLAQLEATTAVDWRERGAVTAVKNQARCGSCWTFSTTGAIEGANVASGTGELVSLSEQYFVSCARDRLMNGCHGGVPLLAYRWAIHKMGGKVVTEEAYPYVSGNGTVPACAGDLHTKPVGAVVRGYKALPHNEEQMAAWLVQRGPISIGIAVPSSFMHYQGGVLTMCPATRPGHAVLIVGWTSEGPYGGAWVVKNSWGAEYGEAGYVRLQYNTNMCNIVAMPTAPTM
eukprot:TRINITY_DN6347_c0_g1_i1.p1 TRINITY_DN6347_c0_g1~~TRINITY_DN6347_c0_g1_i1.p1  ORF type:complete len:341 (+),score=117.11 TRINITY_DN6347_c0_g1_i1:57-1079(+)